MNVYIKECRFERSILEWGCCYDNFDEIFLGRIYIYWVFCLICLSNFGEIELYMCNVEFKWERRIESRKWKLYIVYLFLMIVLIKWVVVKCY